MLCVLSLNFKVPWCFSPTLSAYLPHGRVADAISGNEKFNTDESSALNDHSIITLYQIFSELMHTSKAFHYLLLSL